QQNLLEQRATGELATPRTYWSSAQVRQKPIGTARRNLLEQRATGELATQGPIGATRKFFNNLLEQRAGEGFSTAKTYWSSAQDLLEQRASSSKTCWSSAQVGANLLEQRAGHSHKLLIF